MNNRISIFFAGDFCSQPSTASITVSMELRNLIQSCDLKSVNFEVPLKPNVSLPKQKRERFFQNDDAPAFLQGLGFNLFSLANNHAFDWGDEGFIKTKEVLGENAFGAGTYDEAYRVKVMEVQGVKIGFLALSFAAYTGVFDDVTNHEGLGCAYINDLKVNHVIIEAKEMVDYLFVLPHDGIEYIDIPMPETIARYRDFIDYGADGVIATHPHCPQGWEVYKNKPIFYSLGNFLFNSKERYEVHAKEPHWYEGICVLMSISEGNLLWEVINTRNVGNIGIEIDNSEVRMRHNEYLKEVLQNREKYNLVLKKECSKLAKEKEMPIIDTTFHKETMKACSLLLLKNWVKLLRKREISNDFSLRTLMRNDTRRNLLLRSVK